MIPFGALKQMLTECDPCTVLKNCGKKITRKYIHYAAQHKPTTRSCQTDPWPRQIRVVGLVAATPNETTRNNHSRVLSTRAPSTKEPWVLIGLRVPARMPSESQEFGRNCFEAGQSKVPKRPRGFCRFPRLRPNVLNEFDARASMSTNLNTAPRPTSTLHPCCPPPG